MDAHPGMRVAPGVAKQYRPVCKAAVSVFTRNATVTMCNTAANATSGRTYGATTWSAQEPGGLAAAGGETRTLARLVKGCLVAAALAL
jgi:hypothetical protein